MITLRRLHLLSLFSTASLVLMACGGGNHTDNEPIVITEDQTSDRINDGENHFEAMNNPSSSDSLTANSDPDDQTLTTGDDIPSPSGGKRSSSSGSGSLTGMVIATVGMLLPQIGKLFKSDSSDDSEEGSESETNQNQKTGELKGNSVEDHESNEGSSSSSANSSALDEFNELYAILKEMEEGEEKEALKKKLEALEAEQTKNSSSEDSQISDLEVSAEDNSSANNEPSEKLLEEWRCYFEQHSEEKYGITGVFDTMDTAESMQQNSRQGGEL